MKQPSKGKGRSSPSRSGELWSCSEHSRPLLLFLSKVEDERSSSKPHLPESGSRRTIIGTLSPPPSQPVRCHTLKSTHPQLNLTAAQGETADSLAFFSLNYYQGINQKVTKDNHIAHLASHIAYKDKKSSIYLQALHPPFSTQILSFHFLDIHENPLNTATKIHQSLLYLNTGSAYNMQNEIQCLIICCFPLSFNGFM